MVRLKGGDPLIFGRAGEEIDACTAAEHRGRDRARHHRGAGRGGRLGVSLTDRDNARRLQYVTGHARSGQLPDDIDWRSLADPTTTTAIYMPVKTLDALVAKAVPRGLDPATPAVAVVSATRPDEERFADRIGNLRDLLSHTPSGKPVLVMLGRVFADQVEAQDRADFDGLAALH